MAGYNGFSMSNNAVEAYESGEKPLSKWTKIDIIEEIENAIREEELTLNCSIEKLKNTPVNTLKNLCLCYSSWHHTSNHYNRTDFYSLDMYRIERLTDEKIDKAIDNYKSEKSIKRTEEKWKCAFLEWGGTRKHPTATEVIEEGIVKGDWFYRSNGSKKKTTANGFKFIEKIQ
mgnify:CR=1 FL=1